MRVSRSGGPRRWLASLVLAATAGACAGAPEVVALPEPLPVDATDARRPADELVVHSLREGGVLGGQIAATVGAPPSSVVEMLLDFEHADGHRAWATHHEVVSREAGRVIARWEFTGKLGIHPSAEFAFDVEPLEEGWSIRFRQLESVFGLAAFFGDHRILPVSGDPETTLLVSRVFIDSGLPFVGASRDDIAAGLREDVRRLRAWAEARSRENATVRAGPGREPFFRVHSAVAACRIQR